MAFQLCHHTQNASLHHLVKYKSSKISPTKAQQWQTEHAWTGENVIVVDELVVYGIHVSQGSVATHFGVSMIVLSQIFQGVCQWKNFENLLRIDKVIDQTWLTTFPGTQWLISGLIHLFLHATARSVKRILAIVILSVRLSVCPSVTTRYRFKTHVR